MKAQSNWVPQPAWIAQNTWKNLNVHAVHFRSQDTGFVVGSSGSAYTYNGGEICLGCNGFSFWSPDYGSSYFYDVAYNGKEYYAVGKGIYNLSKSVTVCSSSQILSGIAFPSTQVGYALGMAGTIFKTINGGMNWTTIPGFSSIDFRSVFFTDDSTGYIGGREIKSNYGVLYKTVNGGLSWSSQIGLYQARDIYDIFFVNDTLGYALEISGSVLKTTNGGGSWTKGAPIKNFLYSFYFTDATTGFVVGIGGSIFKTINGGRTWSKQTSGTTKDLRSVYFVNADTGFAVGDSGTILKTYTGGENSGIASVISGYCVPSGTNDSVCSPGPKFRMEGDTLIIHGKVEGGCCALNTLQAVKLNDTIYIKKRRINVKCGDCCYCLDIKIKMDSTDSFVNFEGSVFNKKEYVDGLSESNHIPLMNLFPNPNKGTFSVTFSNPLAKLVRIKIIDLSGRILFEKFCSQDSFFYNERSLQPGIYGVIVEGESIYYSEKIVVIE